MVDARGIGRVNSPDSQLAAIILAGGRSTRMGMDKAQVKLNGCRLIDILIAELPATVCPVVISPHQLNLDCRQVCEDPPFQGPVAGIAAALPHCLAADFISVLAVDAPLSPRLIPTQLELLSANHHARVCAVIADGFVHPLGALWRGQALHQTMDDLAGNYDVPLKSLFRQVGVITIQGDGNERDFDTKEELARFGHVSFE